MKICTDMDDFAGFDLDTASQWTLVSAGMGIVFGMMRDLKRNTGADERAYYMHALGNIIGEIERRKSVQP